MPATSPKPGQWLRRFANRHRLLLTTVAALATGLKILDWCFPLNLPDPNQSFSKVVVDERGEPLRAFADSNGIWRQRIDLDSVSPLYIEALLNYEDRWFWQHGGVNPVALTRAAFSNWRYERIVSGGSTLTMQVARILHPHPRSYGGKLQQIARALQLEWHLDKREILELYLNYAPFGGTVEGVQAASFAYLDKPASELTHAEAALLAVLPQSPSRLRPDRFPGRAQQARNKVLKRLAEFDVWSDEHIAAARLEIVTGFPPVRPNAAPLLSRQLAQQSEHQLIRTTLDGNLQRGLEQHLASFIQNQPQRSSGAILVIDNRTMAVKAYVGSADFSDQNRFGHVDMIRALRSPGSTLKPFIYGLAIDRGVLHSHSLLSDTPREYGEYRPRNFHRSFSGPVSVTEALQRSLNIPAVQALELLGAESFYRQMRSAGVHLQLPNRAKPTAAIALGGVGTSLWELTAAYSALARNGASSPPRLQPQQRITERYLLSPEAAWVTWNMLATAPRPDRLRLTGLKDNHRTLAWKTGTSYGARDTWAMGVNANYTIGVWLGRPDGTAMPGHFGAVTAAPLLFRIADSLPSQHNEPPTKPAEVTQQAICWPLGTRREHQPAEHCHQTHRAWIVRELAPPTAQQPNSAGGYRNPITLWVDRRSGLLATPDSTLADKQKKHVAVWPKALEPWLPSQWTRRQLIPRPNHQRTTLTTVASGSLKITGIDNGYQYRAARPGAQPPVLELKAIGGAGQRSWYRNGVFIGAGGERQAIPLTLDRAGNYQLVAIDSAGNLDRVEVQVLGPDG